MVKLWPSSWFLAVSVAVSAFAATAQDAGGNVLRELALQERPLVYLTAARQKEEVAQALREAGFELADTLLDTPYMIRATIGISGRAKACGSRSNVKYRLRRQKKTLLEVQVKGWTGTCEPNALRAASVELMRQLRAAADEGEDK